MDSSLLDFVLGGLYGVWISIQPFQFNTILLYAPSSVSVVQTIQKIENNPTLGIVLTTFATMKIQKN